MERNGESNVERNVERSAERNVERSAERNAEMNTERNVERKIIKIKKHAEQNRRIGSVAKRHSSVVLGMSKNANQ